MSRRVAAVLVLALVVVLPLHAQRRRSVLHPSEETPGGWLAAHSFPLATTEAVGSLDDLEPLRGMLGSARVVGLADGTHGTHEYFTSKLRLIQFLVTRMQFDTVTFEHSYSQAERLNSYVHGANIDVRSGVFPAANEVRYPFWETEELIAVVQWIRDYNLTRGEKPEVSIAGIDIYDGASAASAVVSYLRNVDADAANTAATAYSCVTGSYGSSTPCRDSADAFQKQLVAKESDYVARSSLAAFREASHAATVVVQSFGYRPDARNEAMARNTVWAREQRSATGRIIVWAHAEHLGKTPSLTEFARTSMGGWMKDFFGADFFAIGNAMWDGTYLGLDGNSASNNPPLVTTRIVPASGDAYENFFHAGRPAFLLPLRTTLHPFLRSAHHLRTAGFSNTNNWDYVVDLAAKFDALLWVEQTTPTHPINPP
jgi:erythromycin esterase